MDPPTLDDGMGRARSAASYLASLPLCNNKLWGANNSTVHDTKNHVQARRGGLPPSRKVPTQSWWHRQARDIVNAAFQDVFQLKHPDPLSAIRDRVNHHRRDDAYTAVNIPPDSVLIFPSSHHANIILYAAIVVKIVKLGIHNMENHEFASRAIRIAEICFDAELRNCCGYSDGPSSPAIMSADGALRFLRRRHYESVVAEEKATSLARRQQEEATRQAELARDRKLRLEQHLSTQQLARRNKSLASNLLWQQQSAATTINRWLRRIIFRRHIQLRISKRYRLRSRCQGASNYANNIKACRPPTPTASISTSLETQPTDPTTSTHPFRDRGLPLPPRKRQQRNRRPRRRPPRKYRGEPSPFSPPNNQPVDLQRSSSTASPAPENTNAVPPSLRTSSQPFPDDAAVAPSATPASRYQKPMALTPMPLCFWAAQTIAAHREFNLGIHPPPREPTFLPHLAATTIQNWVRRNQRLLLHQHTVAATTIQRWYRIHPAATIIQRWLRRTTRRHLFLTHAAATKIQSRYRGTTCRFLIRRVLAASFLQRWLRRTTSRVLFQRCSEALCFQPESTWIRWTELAVKTSTTALLAYYDLMQSASTNAHTSLLSLMEGHFAGMESTYNIVQPVTLRARAYSMIAEFLSAECKRWADSGAYDFTFISCTARVAESLLATARDLHPSDGLDMSEDFGMAQMEVDETKQAIRLIATIRIQQWYRRARHSNFIRLTEQIATTIADMESWCATHHCTTPWQVTMAHCNLAMFNTYSTTAFLALTRFSKTLDDGFHQLRTREPTG